MGNMMSRRAVLAILGAAGAGAAGLGLPSAAAANAPLVSLRPNMRGAGFARKSIPGSEQIVAQARLGGKVTFAVADAVTGAPLESRNGSTAIPPASVTKAITALYALDALGAGHRFETRILATGPITNGILDGDLVLAGGGDPTLDSNHLADLAAAIKARGLREVRGRLLVYDGALPRIDRIDADQPDHVGYNPTISGLALNFNRVHFEWRRGTDGYGITMEARTKLLRPQVSMARMRIADRDLPVYTFKSTPARDEWTVSRRALGRGGARWLPVRKPALYAGDVFRTLARSHGIVLSEAKTTSSAPVGAPLATHRSKPLQTMLQDMLKYSNNLIAEMVGLAATARRSGKAGSLRASAMQMSRWADAALGMSRVRLVDHSGLGEASRMTADDMAAALVQVRAGGFRAMLKPIAMRDAQGKVLKSHRVRVRAKTGTLNFVSALAGYMTAPDGRELAFAIFAADQKTRARISRANREAPPGARGWNTRAKRMQQALIERWGALYDE